MKNPRAALTPKPSPEPRVKLKHHPREVGGSSSKEFNHVLIKQVVGSLWTAHAADKEAEIELYDAAAAALAGIKPKDEIEGMLAAQMVAAHSASMECRRCRHAGGRAKRAAAGRDDQATIARFGSAPPSSDCHLTAPLKPRPMPALTLPLTSLLSSGMMSPPGRAGRLAPITSERRTHQHGQAVIYSVRDVLRSLD
ncbi:MAG TPA: hypothetical protein VKA90_07540 [Beijerinckiaceae bacterium]|nr:hypothetical protein [Beijerinckiaceae bacterium]